MDNETALTVITRDQWQRDMIAGLGTELAHIAAFLRYIGSFVPETLMIEYIHAQNAADTAWNTVSGVAA